MRVPRGRRGALRDAIGEGLRASGERIGPAADSARAIAGDAAATGADLLRRGGELLVDVYWWLSDVAGRRARAAVDWLEAALPPERALAAVILAAAALLALAQFSHFSSIRVGVSAYADVVNEAPAPVVKTSTTGAAHAWVLLPVAVLAAWAGVAALVRGRWQLARIAAIAGGLGIAVALLIDRPQGLDEGVAATNYDDARAVLTGGFWVELSASIALLLCGLLLARRLANWPETATNWRYAPQAHPEPPATGFSSAGSAT
ncbi:MAG: hypothetical protein QOG09_1088 [Solirubrobacterales bacterium]|jgi:hypothetical protein|nr:hypothetical protein [Solirubrobacterales bacterium]